MPIRATFGRIAMALRDRTERGWGLPAPPRLSLPVRLGLALGLPALAQLLHAWLPAVSRGAPFLFFFPTILVVAWVAGRRPALLTVLASAVLASVFNVPPGGGLMLGRREAVLVVPFLLIATLLAMLASGARAQRLERDELLERERKAHADAEEATASRERFLGVASHELKTPLAVLQLQLAALERELAGDGAAKGRLRIARRQIRRLARLVDTITDFPEAARGELELETSEIDLAQLARDTVHGFEEEAERAGSPLVVHAPAAVPARVDPRRLGAAIEQLIANALRFAPGREVEVRVLQDGVPAISVLDRGPGPDGPEPAPLPGLGLGLASAHLIAAAHGGKLELRSRPGGGTEARLVLSG